jgi:hypothetical protein
MSDKYQRPKYKEIRYTGIKTKIPEGYDYFQLKMDGMYATLTIRDGVWSIVSRTGVEKASGMWPSTSDHYVLTGEYMKGSHWAKRQGIEEDSFYAFDIHNYKGMSMFTDDSSREDKDYYLRDKYILRAVSNIKERVNHLVFAKDSFTIKKVNTYQVAEWYRTWTDVVEDKDYEGLIFRNSYQKLSDTDKHPLRMKKVVEMDYICVGFEPADERSRYKGLVGGVKGTLIDKDIVVECGGLTDEQRREYTANAENYIGKIFTAKGNDWFPSGSIRHPKFREWRTDKTHYECSYTQVPKDIRSED